mmetsp:Transcript_80896/g.205583  ORF Transcript_80896/g.205583 Transcript_80896/m.205583 type:complete len:311 (-) Transcript_80896:203-1135(-)
MGAVCARCNEVKKGNGDGKPPALPMHPDEDSDANASSEADNSEVAASSDEEENHEDYKQSVEQILKSTGKNLKRGKTMAMKEAISTAKKYGLDGSKITEAQRQLDEHVKQQRREECEREVEAFFTSPAVADITLTEKMVSKATEADVSVKTLQKLQEKFEVLLLCRSLEADEVKLAREALKQSCRDFVFAATQGGGRPVTLLNLEDGSQEKAIITLDPPLRNLLVIGDITDVETVRIVPVRSLSAVLGKDEKKVSSNSHFKALDPDERECSVAVRYSINKTPGMFCFLEPTEVRRDRLIEGVVILAVSCS